MFEFGSLTRVQHMEATGGRATTCFGIGAATMRQAFQGPASWKLAHTWAHESWQRPPARDLRQRKSVHLPIFASSDPSPSEAQAPDLRPGIAKELRRHVAIREPEIAEMES
jgi:hypothetical protein